MAKAVIPAVIMVKKNSFFFMALAELVFQCKNRKLKRVKTQVNKVLNYS